MTCRIPGFARSNNSTVAVEGFVSITDIEILIVYRLERQGRGPRMYIAHQRGIMCGAIAASWLLYMAFGATAVLPMLSIKLVEPEDWSKSTRPQFEDASILRRGIGRVVITASR
jgi:hypothetical protein